MADKAIFTPAPDAVAAMVDALVAGPWPTTDAERRKWFLSHQLDMTPTKRRGDSVDSEGPSAWGNPSGGWHFHQGEFVGLHWFLWADEPWATVVQPAATRLQELLTQIAGPPDDVDTATGPAIGFRASWWINGRDVDMYAHGPQLDATGEAHELFTTVQLHIDDVDRSNRKDQEALARQRSRPAHRIER